MNLALATIGLGNSSINHFDHDWCDVKTRTVAFNKRDDGLQRNSQRHILVDHDFFALGGQLDMLIQNNLQKMDDLAVDTSRGTPVKTLNHSNHANYEPT